jgi:hypothetical protein
MIFFTNEKIFSKSDIVNLFKSADWESADYPEKLFNAVSHSETVISAWDDKNLIGIMTAVSDGDMNVFFPYLLINEDYRGNHIGRTIVSMMLKRYKSYYRKVLVCDRDKAGFYEKNSFVCEKNQRPMMIIDKNIM